MILTTKTCDTCKHFPNDKHCVGCVWDEDKQENTKWELKENPIVIERERGVLDAIRAEIERQERWLMDTGYNACSVDIAFDAIKSVLAESEDKE